MDEKRKRLAELVRREWEAGRKVLVPAAEVSPILRPNPPGLLTKAGNFARSAGRHVLHGLPTVPPEERDRRLAVCGGCPQLNRDAGTCNSCGCLVKTKASWALEKCPLGKW